MADTVIYYHGDADGQLAAHVYFRAHPEGQLVPVQYGTNNRLDPKPNAHYVVLDFCFENMGELIEQGYIKYWADHHATAQERFPNQWASSLLPGPRDTSKAACLQVLEAEWDYLPRDDTMNCTLSLEKLRQVVHAIAIVDANDKTCGAFQEAVDFSIAFSRYFKNTPPSVLGHFIAEMDIVDMEAQGGGYRMLSGFDGDTILENGFECRIGSLKAIVMNSVLNIQDACQRALRKADVAICAAMRIGPDNKPYWSYSVRGSKNVDCTELAKKYGGGGHKGAAGFSSEHSPIELFWNVAIEKQEV